MGRRIKDDALGAAMGRRIKDDALGAVGHGAVGRGSATGGPPAEGGAEYVARLILEGAAALSRPAAQLPLEAQFEVSYRNVGHAPSPLGGWRAD